MIPCDHFLFSTVDFWSPTPSQIYPLTGWFADSITTMATIVSKSTTFLALFFDYSPVYSHWKAGDLALLSFNQYKHLFSFHLQVAAHPHANSTILEFLAEHKYKWEHYLQPINQAPRRHKPRSVARGRDRPRRVPYGDKTWAPLERRSRDVDRGRATR